MDFGGCGDVWVGNAWFVNSVHSVYLYLYICPLCFMSAFMFHCLFYFVVVISFTLFMLPLLVVNKGCNNGAMLILPGKTLTGHEPACHTFVTGNAGHQMKGVHVRGF